MGAGQFAWVEDPFLSPPKMKQDSDIIGEATPSMVPEHEEIEIPGVEGYLPAFKIKLTF